MTRPSLFCFLRRSPYTRGVPPLSVTIITFNEAAHLAAAIGSVAWADEIVVIDSGSTDGTQEIARRLASRVEVREWPGYAVQKNYAASVARHDWILSLDADERVSGPLAESLQAWRRGEPDARGYRVARTSCYLGAWMRTTDWYPDYQLRLYDRRAGAWQPARVHESVRVTGEAALLAGEIEHYPYADVSDHLDRIDRYTTLAALDLRERARSAGALALILHPAAAFLRNYILRRGFRQGRAGLVVSLLNSYYVLLKYVKLLEIESAFRAPTVPPDTHVLDSHRHGNDVARRAEPGAAHGDGPALRRPPRHARRAPRRRTAAAGGGRARLVPLAPSHELDLKAGWKLSRLFNRLRPDIVHAHDPHAVSTAALALSMSTAQPVPPLVASRRVDYHLKKNSFSQWKYRQVRMFLAASGAIARILRADGVPAAQIVTVHEGIDAERIAHIEPASVHAAFWLPTHAPVIGNIGALVAHKGQRHLIDAAAILLRDVPDARVVILGEGELRSSLEHQVKALHLEKHVLLPGFREDVLALLKGFDMFVMCSETEGLGT